MGIGAASSLSLYNYLSALQGSTSASSQNSAVLQALTTAYSNSTSSSSILGSDALPSLVGAIYSKASAAGASSSSLFSSLSSLSTDTTSTASLLASLGTSGSNGFSSSAINSNATLALTAYTNQMNGMPTTITAAAKKVLSGIDTTDPNAIQSLIQSSQTAAFSSVLDILS